MLRIDFWNIAFTIINLIVLYLILKKFLIAPVMNVMKLRQDMIDNQFQDAARVKTEADHLKQDYEEKMMHAKEESVKIVEDARVSAAREYDAKLKDAEEQTKKMYAQEQEKIDMERDKTLREMQSRIATLAMAAAGKIVKEECSGDKNSSIYNQFLAKAGERNDTDGN